MIQRVMAEEGVPQDLIYLAVAESGFQAAGGQSQLGRGRHVAVHAPRQVLRARAQCYVDERFDPEKSTRAYARYMKFIYNQLGDWYLAMAAYNWGAGNVQRAVQKTGYADFWELYKRNNLPEQTKNYVPKFSPPSSSPRIPRSTASMTCSSIFRCLRHGAHRLLRRSAPGGRHWSTQPQELQRSIPACCA
jgi:hypothetical protein